MNRVICDVCGTKYPESSEQCPICGCAKPENARVISNEVGTQDNESTGKYAHVKGGRFSKSNVRKRNKAAAAAAGEVKAELDTETAPKEKEGNRGLVIAVVALLLAIVAVMLFVFFKYFVPSGSDEIKDTTPVIETTTTPTTEETVQTTAADNACSALVLSATSIELSQIGDSWLLSVEITPQDTTDVLTFTSSDTSVAEVNAEGRITAVAAGEATITVTCGDIAETCSVSVTDPSATTETTASETTEATTAVETADWKLNRKDFTLSAAGDTWMLYKGDVDVEDITWTSDDPAVATFEKGVVTAVGPGHTKVHAEYNGTKYSCDVHCSFTVSPSDETTNTEPSESTAATEDTQPAETQGNYSLYIYNAKVKGEEGKLGDATIKVGEYFPLTLRNDNGDIISVSWSIGNDEICSIINNVVKGLSKGETEITVEYFGNTYKCIVRVK